MDLAYFGRKCPGICLLHDGKMAVFRSRKLWSFIIPFHTTLAKYKRGNGEKATLVFIVFDLYSNLVFDCDDFQKWAYFWLNATIFGFFFSLFNHLCKHCFAECQFQSKTSKLCNLGGFCRSVILCWIGR